MSKLSTAGDGFTLLYIVFCGGIPEMPASPGIVRPHGLPTPQAGPEGKMVRIPVATHGPRAKLSKHVRDEIEA